MFQPFQGPLPVFGTEIRLKGLKPCCKNPARVGTVDTLNSASKSTTNHSLLAIFRANRRWFSNLAFFLGGRGAASITTGTWRELL